MSTDSKPDSTISDYVYASTSIEHTSISTSKEFTSKEVLLEDLSKSGGPWERLVHFIRTVNTEYWAIISSILCILVFAALCVIIVLCRKKGRGKQTNTDHRLYTSNRYIEQTDGERYCDLNTYTDPLEVKMNVCFGGHQVAQGTTEYMHSDSMFEERTDSHEYVSMNTHCYTELSNVNDSKPKDYGSSEHVYMRI
ncbi:uncharacterized protein LOC133172550 [Saccostrea echinata]|uniref:uncharacterized protein LOC133172550 n=1 Tax=Saccostrea echinata TaxID=191078 RepID=UPI002A8278ED|nr:uncharacterized protein LOC133172550 [Saccostrea echinata]